VFGYGTGGPLLLKKALSLFFSCCQEGTSIERRERITENVVLGIADKRFSARGVSSLSLPLPNRSKDAAAAGFGNGAGSAAFAVAKLLSQYLLYRLL